MKIAILLLSGGLVQRGAEHSMLMLADDLDTFGHQTTVFQTGPSERNSHSQVKQIQLPIQPTSHKPTTAIGKIFERLYLNQRSVLSLLFTIKCLKYLRSYDVIIPTDGFWSVLLCKMFKSPHSKIVCVGLAGIGWTDADTLNVQPDAFVALSTQAATWAKNINSRVNVVTIPLQVDLSRFTQVKPYSHSLAKPVVLTVAALTKYKRVDLVIKAVAQIPAVSLLIIGQGEEKANLTRLADKLLPHRYQILSVHFEQLPSVYQACDVFTLASAPQEAFGQVLIEAMAAGLPIVTTNDPIRKEIVGRQGIYVDPTNNQSLIKGLNTALSQNRITYDCRRFDRLEIAKQYHELFDRLQ